MLSHDGWVAKVQKLKFKLTFKIRDTYIYVKDNSDKLSKAIDNSLLFKQTLYYFPNPLA